MKKFNRLIYKGEKMFQRLNLKERYVASKFLEEKGVPPKFLGCFSSIAQVI